MATRKNNLTPSTKPSPPTSQIRLHCQQGNIPSTPQPHHYHQHPRSGFIVNKETYPHPLNRTITTNIPDPATLSTMKHTHTPSTTPLPPTSQIRFHWQQVNIPSPTLNRTIPTDIPVPVTLATSKHTLTPLNRTITTNIPDPVSLSTRKHTLTPSTAPLPLTSQIRFHCQQGNIPSPPQPHHHHQHPRSGYIVNKETYPHPPSTAPSPLTSLFRLHWQQVNIPSPPSTAPLPPTSQIRFHCQQGNIPSPPQPHHYH